MSAADSVIIRVQQAVNSAATDEQMNKAADELDKLATQIPSAAALLPASNNSSGSNDAETKVQDAVQSALVAVIPAAAASSSSSSSSSSPPSSSAAVLPVSPAVMLSSPVSSSPPFIGGYPSAGADYKAGAIDANTTGVPRDVILGIAKRFQPIVILTSGEIYRPCTMEEYLGGANLLYDPVGNETPSDYITVKEKPVIDDLVHDALWTILSAYQAIHKDARLNAVTQANIDTSRFHLACRTEADQTGCDWANLNKVPYLVRVRRYSDHWEILYVCLFCFNGPFKVCCSWQDAHSCDIEHVTVRTNSDATALDWVFYGAHGDADGVWRRPHEIEVRKGAEVGLTEPTHPVIYSADHSHGMYPSPGTWWRICGFANDIPGPEDNSDHHNAWNPIVDPVLMFDSKDPRYAQENAPGAMYDTKYLEYGGTMGEDGIQPPQNQGWWANESVWQNNCFRRMWWPCRYISWTNDNNFCYNSCQSKIDFNSGYAFNKGQTMVPPAPAPATMS